MSLAARPIVLPFHHCGPITLEAALEDFEVRRLRPLYSPKTVYEKMRVLKRAVHMDRIGVLKLDPHDLAVRLYAHMSNERAARHVANAVSIIENFRAWHERNYGGASH